MTTRPEAPEHATAPAPRGWAEHVRPPDAREALAIPGYRIVALLHRGGQGAVYRAHQLSTGRDVAIKVLPGGPHASEAERRRFEREVDLVALLDHPNVVALIDRGVADGHPFFVMRLVEGEDLDAWVARARSSLRERLDLFLACCDAVAHAHARGVIHRDLKPRNIRVDRTGQPHVLDFGLAKTLPLESGAAASSLTIDGHFVGTLAFSAPEQLCGDASQTDVRTDVYALGIVLYWLLTGRHPYPVTGDVSEMLRHVRMTEPVPPSSLAPHVDEDLDTVVLKALAKDKERRYATVDALATDIRRHLAGEPMEARRDSRWYVLRKTARRYRVALAVLAGFVALLAVTAMAVLSQRNEALRQEARARSEAERTRIEAQAAQRVTDVMVDLFRLPEGQTDGAENFRVLDALDKGARESLPKLDADPAVKARLLAALSRSYMTLGRHVEARPLAEESYRLFKQLGVRDREFLDVATTIGSQLRSQGRHCEAITYFQEAVDVARADMRLPPQILPDALAKLGTALDTADESASGMARYEEALSVARATLEPDDPLMASLLSGLAELHGRHRRLKEGEALRDEALALLRARHGDTHVSIADILKTWSVLHTTAKRYDEAAAEGVEALRIYEVVRPRPDAATAELRSNLAATRYFQGRYDEAAALARSALDELRASAGDDTPAVGMCLSNLAEFEDKRGGGPRSCAAWNAAREWQVAHGASLETIANSTRRLAELGCPGG